MKIRGKLITVLLLVSLSTIIALSSVMFFYVEVTVGLVGSVIFVAFASSVMAIIVSQVLTNMFLKPLQWLVNIIQWISSGDLKRSISINRRDEFGELAFHLDRMRQSMLQSRKQLENLNMELEQRVEERTMELELKTARLNEELTRGRMVQVSMLPDTFPEIAGWEFYGASIAAEEIGGDYYDFLTLNSDHLGITIGDVSGKGITSALVMAMAKSGLYAQIPFNPPPNKTLDSVNQIICKASSAKRLLTLFYAKIDMDTGEMEYANAGHTFPYVCRKNGSGTEFFQLKETSFPLGVQEKLIFHNQKYVIQPGDTLVFYTIGLVDAIDASEELFGFPRFEEVLKNSHHLSASEVLNEVFIALGNFCLSTPQRDDITISVVKRLK